jgi:uncharacterized membrane protein YukC
MNTLSIVIISILVVSFALYFYFSRKLIRELIESIKYSKQAFDAMKKDYNTLSDQYRQVSKINEALRSISQVKSSKKK